MAYVNVNTTTLETMSEASAPIKDYSCTAPSAARDGDMLSVYMRALIMFPAPYADIKPAASFAASAARSGVTPLILRASNTKTGLAVSRPVFAIAP